MTISRTSRWFSTSMMSWTLAARCIHKRAPSRRTPRKQPSASFAPCEIASWPGKPASTSARFHLVFNRNLNKPARRQDEKHVENDRPRCSRPRAQLTPLGKPHPPAARRELQPLRAPRSEIGQGQWHSGLISFFLLISSETLSLFESDNPR